MMPDTWECACDMGAKAYKQGKPRDGGPFFGKETDMDPLDAVDGELASWLFSWDEAEMLELELRALDLGADAGLCAEPCPYDIYDYRLREAWIEGWLVSVCGQSNNFPVEH